MSLSLREQLLQAGLVGSKQVKKAEQENRQQARKNPAVQSEKQQALQKQQAEKIARDKELNRKRDEERQRQARLAEIRQLVEQNRLPRIESDEYFNFVHRNKVHRIAVDTSLRERITSGQVILVRYGKFYASVLPDIAEKVRERDAGSVVDLNAQIAPSAESPDDPYKDFAVPDDLMW